MLLGAVIFGSHFATSVLLSAHNFREPICFWAPRSIMVLFIAIGLWRYRPHSLFLPTNSAERVVWAVWLGYLLSFAALFGVMELLERGHEHIHLRVYGPSMVLSGMAFFVMGAHVWGGCYLIGVAFMLLAPALAYNAESDWCPFWFGTVWGAALLILGARFWWLGRLAELEEAKPR
jgi:hypothetical protein